MRPPEFEVRCADGAVLCARRWKWLAHTERMQADKWFGAICGPHTVHLAARAPSVPVSTGFEVRCANGRVLLRPGSEREALGLAQQLDGMGHPAACGPHTVHRAAVVAPTDQGCSG